MTNSPNISNLIVIVPPKLSKKASVEKFSEDELGKLIDIVDSADNSLNPVLSGIETLGGMLADFEGQYRSIDVSNIGRLIEHLAIEVQYVQLTKSNALYAIKENAKLSGSK